MRAGICIVAVLMGAIGIVTGAAGSADNASMAGKRGLSPIISPPQYTPVIVAQASQATQQSADRTLGVCQPIENKEESRLSAINGLSPVGDAITYLEKFEHRKFDNYEAVFYVGKMTLLQAPMHGELKLGQNSGAYYSKDYNYEGSDSATVLVEVGGHKVKVIYHFVLMQDVPGSGDEGTATDDKSICPKGAMWKISPTLDANGNNIITSVDYQSPIIDVGTTTTDTASLAATLGASILSSLSVDPSLVTINIADLPGGAVGQTVGTNITLDDNAAGYNWFIDTTPWDNGEFLPTSNPNEWVAKAGSDAAGKMDMLSVLLHEHPHEPHRARLA